MPDWPLTLCRASTDEPDQTAITDLIGEASDWLQTKETDQWATPWPTAKDLESRIEAALRDRKTWICWDDKTPAATITADPAEDPYWSVEYRAEPAIYVSRLVVSRPYSGTGLGRGLLDWAGYTASRDFGARWIRVSAWTTNKSLHAYYQRQGFAPCGFHPDDGYPAGARFQKSTTEITPAWFSLFRPADDLL